MNVKELICIPDVHFFLNLTFQNWSGNTVSLFYLENCYSQPKNNSINVQWNIRNLSQLSLKAMKPITILLMPNF